MNDSKRTLVDKSTLSDALARESSDMPGHNRWEHLLGQSVTYVYVCAEDGKHRYLGESRGCGFPVADNPHARWVLIHHQRPEQYAPMLVMNPHGIIITPNKLDSSDDDAESA